MLFAGINYILNILEERKRQGDLIGVHKILHLYQLDLVLI